MNKQKREIQALRVSGENLLRDIACFALLPPDDAYIYTAPPSAPCKPSQSAAKSFSENRNAQCGLHSHRLNSCFDNSCHNADAKLQKCLDISECSHGVTSPCSNKATPRCLPANGAWGRLVTGRLQRAGSMVIIRLRKRPRTWSPWDECPDLLESRGYAGFREETAG
ncbi:MAG: hypothetical protein PHR77_07415 [Kiritimatiellae bacterium]|nr:hypothetical protein [Kiritimatiellia bacterium]MDD5522266.1 hypothetical protein [Kiritimatiellia bacterium]